MKRTLFIGVAAGALIAGVNLAAAQGSMERQPAASGGAKVEQKSSGGAEMKAQSQEKAPATTGQAQGDMKADTKGQAASDSKAQSDMKADTKGQAGTEKGSTAAQDSKGDNKASTSAQGSKGDNKAAAQDAKGDSKASANLSTEQKTKIRETVIKSGPRVTNVNFSVSVGTVVPRTVKYAPLPTVLVDLHPEWRGYYYFIVDERIVIIEPSSFKIITIITV